MKYTDEEIKFIENKFPELKPKQLPSLDYSKLLVKPSLDQIIVSFLFYWVNTILLYFEYSVGFD